MLCVIELLKTFVELLLGAALRDVQAVHCLWVSAAEARAPVLGGLCWACCASQGGRCVSQPTSYPLPMELCAWWCGVCQWLWTSWQMGTFYPWAEYENFEVSQWSPDDFWLIAQCIKFLKGKWYLLSSNTSISNICCLDSFMLFGFMMVFINFQLIQTRRMCSFFLSPRKMCCFLLFAPFWVG